MEGGVAWETFQDSCLQLAAFQEAELSSERAEEARELLELVDVALRELLSDPKFRTANTSLEKPSTGSSKSDRERQPETASEITPSEAESVEADGSTDPLLPHMSSGSALEPGSCSSSPLLPQIHKLLYSSLGWVRATGWFLLRLCLDAGLHLELESGLSSELTNLLVRAVDGSGGDTECHEALYLTRKLIASQAQIPEALSKAAVALASVSGSGCLDPPTEETGPVEMVNIAEPAKREKPTPGAFDDWDTAGPAGRVSREASPGVKIRNDSPNRTAVSGRSEEGSRSRAGSGLSVVSYASDTSSSGEPGRGSSSGRGSLDAVSNRVSSASSSASSRTFPLGGTEIGERNREGSAWSDTTTSSSKSTDSRSRNGSVKSEAERSREGSFTSLGGSDSPRGVRSKQGSLQFCPPETELDTIRETSDGKQGSPGAVLKRVETFRSGGVEQRGAKPPGPKWEAVGVLIALLSSGHTGKLKVANNRGLSALLKSLQECPGESEALRLTIAAAIALLLADPVSRKACSRFLPHCPLAPLVSPFLEAAIATRDDRNSGERKNGTDPAEAELARVLKANGEALLAVARNWSGLFLLAELRDRKRNGKTERKNGTERNEAERNASHFGDLVVALQTTKNEAVVAALLTLFSGLLLETSPCPPLLLNVAQTPLGTYLSVLVCALQTAGLPAALHKLALQPGRNPARTADRKAPENGTAALRLLCHVGNLSEALLPWQLRRGSESAMDFVGDILGRPDSQDNPGLQRNPDLRRKPGLQRISGPLNHIDWNNGRSEPDGLESGHAAIVAEVSRCNGNPIVNLREPAVVNDISRLHKTRGLRSAHFLPGCYSQCPEPVDAEAEAEAFASLENIGVEATVATLESAQVGPQSGDPILTWDSEDLDHLVKSSGVLEKRSKEWVTWDWAVIRMIVSGPFRTSPQKFFHGSKFLKRVTGFFSKRLPGICTGDEPPLCVEVGRELVAALLETDEGCAYVSGRGSKKSKQECLLLETLAAGLRAELAPDGREKKRPFSGANLRKTLAPQFLAMTLTPLTGNERGILLLEKAGVLGSVKSLLSGSGSLTLQTLLLQLINLGPNGDQRQLLTAALSNAHAVALRAFALRHAARILSARFEGTRARAPFDRWLLERVLKQLSDGDATVRRIAAGVLEKGCSELEGFTEGLVAVGPRVEQLLGEGDELALAVLASNAGFEFLKQTSWFTTSLQLWTANTGSESAAEPAAYALAAERAITRTLLSQTPNPSSRDDLLRGSREVQGLPRHFLSALAASASGLKIVETSGVLRIATEKLLDSCAGVLDRRAAAWSLAHVAACGGAAACHVIDIGGLDNLERGVRGAVGNLGLRGTFLQALGLSASSSEVKAWLKEREWVTNREESFDVEASRQSVYSNMFDGPKVEPAETSSERWEIESSVGSLSEFLREPLPSKETEVAFYDHMFGVTASKPAAGAPQVPQSTTEPSPLESRTATSPYEEQSSSKETAFEIENRAKEGIHPSVCLPQNSSVLFASTSARALEHARAYRARLTRAHAARAGLRASSGTVENGLLDGETVTATDETQSPVVEAPGDEALGDEAPVDDAPGAAGRAELERSKKALALLNGLCNPVTADESRAELEELLEEFPSLAGESCFRAAARALLNDYHFPRGVRLAIHVACGRRPLVDV